MSKTRVIPFAAEHLEAVARFAQRLWPWPSDEAFYRWRFLDCASFHHAYLALRDGECLAMICAFERELLLDGRRRRVIDGFDWAVAPDEPAAGTLGFFVLQALLKAHPLPVLGFSGTEISMALRERMGWRSLPPVRRFVLPTAGAWGSLREAATKIAARTYFRPRRRARPASARVVPMTAAGPEVLALYAGETGYATVLVPDLEQLRWLTAGYPGAGSYLPLGYFVDGRVRGWVLARLYYEEGRCEAVLVECFAPRPTRELYTWMVSEALLRLLPFGPSRVRAAASCPRLIAALGDNRFLERRPIPLDFKPRDGELPGEPMALTWNGADFPFRPYPRWDWAAPPTGAGGA